jgi:transcriptional regulator GlxA family with amidase domain
MSPIQYQKQIRLLEARQLLIVQPGNAARVAFAVGYESASQFGREYARQFGSPQRATQHGFWRGRRGRPLMEASA